MIDKIKFIASGLWDFLAPFIRILLSQFGRILAEAAMEAVRLMAESGMSGAEKREQAFKIIEQTIKAKGMQASATVINMAIEAAVLKLKDE